MSWRLLPRAQTWLGSRPGANRGCRAIAEAVHAGREVSQEKSDPLPSGPSFLSFLGPSFLRGGDESGPDRIELDVAEDGPEVGVVHGGTLESALPEMA